MSNTAESSDDTDKRRAHPSLRGLPTAVKTSVAALTIGALGVVFGDIGTSPLYAVQTVFSTDNGVVHPNHLGVYGVISLVFWAITLTVSVKYVGLIMRADNEGEGGIMALISLIRHVVLKNKRTKVILVTMGILGASLFYGDGMITPAISVISSVEGLDVISPSLKNLIVPLTILILAALFIFQRRGTGTVGRFFGPVIGVWFVVLAIGGVGQIVQRPGILAALLPSYAARFFVHSPSVAFIALGGVVLAVTGAEALYADLGHFGRPAISRAWFFLAFPALTLNYLGQGALILHNPHDIEGVLFLLYPHWALYPMVLLSTVATVIASQAVITGAFSLSRQAVQLGFLPRLRILHTSQTEGQIYVPAVNWILFVGVCVIVAGFGSSEHLASAYGIAVTGTFITTSILFLVIARKIWRRPLWQLIPIGAIMLTVDITFFAANVRKIADGGWLPLLVALVTFTIFVTWQRGREIVTENRTRKEGPIGDLLQKLREMKPAVKRVPGTAVYLHANLDTAPLALKGTVEHTHCLHRHVTIMRIDILPYPHVDIPALLTIEDLGGDDLGVVGVTARLGYQDEIDVPALIKIAHAQGMPCDKKLEKYSYFISQVSIRRTDEPGMKRWRKRLFVAISHQAANPAEYFGVPDDRTVIMGARVKV